MIVVGPAMLLDAVQWALVQIIEPELEDGLGGHATNIWPDDFDFVWPDDFDFAGASRVPQRPHPAGACAVVTFE
jgi:hypothetical protein